MTRRIFAGRLCTQLRSPWPDVSTSKHATAARAAPKSPNHLGRPDCGVCGVLSTVWPEEASPKQARTVVLRRIRERSLILALMVPPRFACLTKRYKIAFLRLQATASNRYLMARYGADRPSAGRAQRAWTPNSALLSPSSTFSALRSSLFATPSPHECRSHVLVARGSFVAADQRDIPAVAWRVAACPNKHLAPSSDRCTSVCDVSQGPTGTGCLHNSPPSPGGRWFWRRQTKRQTGRAALTCF